MIERVYIGDAVPERLQNALDDVGEALAQAFEKHGLTPEECANATLNIAARCVLTISRSLEAPVDRVLEDVVKAVWVYQKVEGAFDSAPDSALDGES